jgi:hypothetical protein
MNVKCNNLFDALMYKYLKHKIKIKYSKQLKVYDIVNIDGCYYFSFLAPLGPFSSDLHDRTGNEVLNNRFLLEDYLNSTDNINIFIEQGLIFIYELKKKLEKYDCKFKIIFNINDYPSITFHKIRDNEFFLSHDLNIYSSDKIIEFVVY